MINRVDISDFIFIDKFQFSGFSNLNVIIGENDSGKTSLLKLLYATAKSWEEFTKKQHSEKPTFKKVLSEKMFNTFQPRKRGLGDLVNRRKEAKLEVGITFFENTASTQTIEYSFSKDASTQIIDCKDIPPVDIPSFNALFIPAKEVLTAFEAIRATRVNLFMYGFDDTYLDLINSLSLQTSRDRIAPTLTEVNKKLEDLFAGEIVQSSDEEKFVFRKNKTEYSMALTAEGIKKIGILTTLIRNRQLSENTILFLDEPEALLHPKAIRELVKILFLLSQTGVQIFLTTHSFFVIKQMELTARRHKSTITCCSLERVKNKIQPSFHNLQNGMPSNAIIDAALELYNEEVSLEFRKNK